MFIEITLELIKSFGITLLLAVVCGFLIPKVNVNSYRDIFEGALTTNNVLVGETAVVVESEAIDAIEDFDGTIIGGSPEILKLACQ